MRVRRLLLLIFVFLIFHTTIAFGQLRELVAIVEPRFYESTREQFTAWADYFAEVGDDYWSRFFRWYSGELGAIGHGTGWLYVDSAGENYIITNRHVVKQAATANIVFESEEGERTTFADCPIVYVDERMDLAVLQFPDGESVFDVGLPILDTRQPDGTRILAAGFPGFGGGQPLWQYSDGIVSNAAARIDANYDYLVQHTAPIDPGNSGGPLMIQDESAAFGYRVVGVNTSKATGRENTNFAIPAKHVLEVLDKTREAIRQNRSPSLLLEELESSSESLASELSSEAPDREEVGRFISYAFVGERGLQSYSELVSLVEDPAVWTESFQDDPIETMRTAIQIRFSLELASIGDLSTLEFVGIDRTDEDDILRAESIRTIFRISGETVEMMWIREYGHWRVMDLDMEALSVSTPDRDTAPRREPGPQVERSVLALGVRGGGGYSASEGDIYDYSEFESTWDGSSWYAGLSADFPLTSLLWFETGILLSHVSHGYYFNGATLSADFDEEITYLQIPAIAKLGFLGYFGNVFVGGGLAVDYAVVAGGEYTSYTSADFGPLTDTYYDGFLRRFNISFLATASYELAIGPRFLIGVEVLYDLHLLGDFVRNVPETSRFSALNGGLYVKYLY